MNIERRVSRVVLPVVSLALLPVGLGLARAAEPGQEEPDIRLFFQAASTDQGEAEAALDRIGERWRDPYAAMLIELIRLMPGGGPTVADGARPESGAGEIIDPETGLGQRSDPLQGPSRFARNRDPRVRARRRLVSFLEDHTGQDFGDDLDAWRRWLWSLEYEPHSRYGFFKGQLYGAIDERFRNFFPPDVPHRVRLDEIDWGGVRVNGIPPLDHPEFVAAGEAGWLAEDHVVFGVVVDDEARAYPKRILAWHEMLLDRVGGVELTVVYCTLCGTVIPYKSEVAGRRVTFGTSGLLYRSNKLMFDDITWSLWSSLTGEPVVGRASTVVEEGMKLDALPVVTTEWGAWRRQHPDTTVLSRETGFERDYSEGAAYRDYFESDEIMFEVSRKDDRLDLKQEVLALRLLPGDAIGPPVALAIDVALLRREPVFHTELAGRRLVVVTGPGGANRVYEAGDREFAAGDEAGWIVDQEGDRWRVGEAELARGADPGARLARVPAFRAFWFGWYAQYPETRLIHR
ncbi:MAG: DUF3179 domain-containing protein [Acidobacteriota bacterium]